LDLFGEEVLPVLRKEYAAMKPAHVPDAPTHASRVAAALEAKVSESASAGAAGQDA
jgi:hypothetical protein